MAESVHELTEGFAVAALDLADNCFDILNRLGGIGEVVELGQRAFAFLFAELFFQLLDGLREFFDVGEQSVFADV